jgi:hypothetical protein
VKAGFADLLRPSKITAGWDWVGVRTDQVVAFQTIDRLETLLDLDLVNLDELEIRAQRKQGRRLPVHTGLFVPSIHPVKTDGITGFEALTLQLTDLVEQRLPPREHIAPRVGPNILGVWCLCIINTSIRGL